MFGALRQAGSLHSIAHRGSQPDLAGALSIYGTTVRVVAWRRADRRITLTVKRVDGTLTRAPHQQEPAGPTDRWDSRGLLMVARRGWEGALCIPCTDRECYAVSMLGRRAGQADIEIAVRGGGMVMPSRYPLDDEVLKVVQGATGEIGLRDIERKLTHYSAALLRRAIHHLIRQGLLVAVAGPRKDSLIVKAVSQPAAASIAPPPLV